MRQNNYQIIHIRLSKYAKTIFSILLIRDCINECTRKKKVYFHPSHLHIPIGPIIVDWKKRQLSTWSAGRHAMEMSLYFSSDIFLLLPSPPILITSVSSIFPNVLLLHLCPCLSAVQCRSSHSACLQAVFLVSLNPSRYFLLFFLNTTCPVNCTNLKLDWSKGVVILCRNNSLTAAFSQHFTIRWNNVTCTFFCSAAELSGISFFVVLTTKLRLKQVSAVPVVLAFELIALEINNLNGPRCALKQSAKCTARQNRVFNCARFYSCGVVFSFFNGDIGVGNIRGSLHLLWSHTVPEFL